jgi:putative cardiolipin synthase
VESELTWAKADVVYDSPEKRNVRKDERLGRLMYPPIAERIAATNSNLLIVTPYLVPTPGEAKLLKEQVERNVQVRILTNSLMSTPDLVAHAGYARHRPALLKDGFVCMRFVPTSEARGVAGSRAS